MPGAFRIGLPVGLSALHYVTAAQGASCQLFSWNALVLSDANVGDPAVADGTLFGDLDFSFSSVSRGLRVCS